MAEPTDEQLKKYADTLPEVYRTALSLFIQQYEDGTTVRRAGTAVNYQWIHGGVKEIHPAYEERDVDVLLERLVEQGFLKLRDKAQFDTLLPRAYQKYLPTPLGERLITAVTGIKPVPEAVPQLPQPAWA